eukprot:snap_masked-scaffold_26-processed-gene-1.18-mRNA-1 protein AED:1.00 eAED:1.00 QI:0/0/0/0/1/1/3/0/542
MTVNFEDILLTLVGCPNEFVDDDYNLKASYIEKNQVSLPEATFIEKILKLGKLFSEISSFLDKKKKAFSLPRQRFLEDLEEYLLEYQEKVVCYIEQVLLNNVRLTASEVHCSLLDYYELFHILLLMLNKLETGKNYLILNELDDMYDRYSLNPFLEEKLCRSHASQNTYFMETLKNVLIEGIYAAVNTDFFVVCTEKNQFASPEDEWYSRFQVEEKFVPFFLEKSSVEKILLCVKYLYFIAQFDFSVDDLFFLKLKSLYLEQIKSSVENLTVNTINRDIDDIFTIARNQVFSCLFKEDNLNRHMQFIRSFFLLGNTEIIGKDDGFFVGEKQVYKEIEMIKTENDCLIFKNLRFPMSLFFSSDLMEKYMELKGFLATIKSSQQVLSQCFKATIRSTCSGKVLQLQHLMTFLVNHLLFYFQEDILDSKFSEFDSTLRALGRNKMSSVEDLVILHKKFLVEVYTACCMSNEIVKKSLGKILSTCLDFGKMVLDGTILQEKENFIGIEKRMQQNVSFLFQVLKGMNSSLLLRLNYNYFFERKDRIA